VLSLVGDVDPEEVAVMVEAALTTGRKAEGATAPPAPKDEPGPSSRLVARLVRPKAQAHLVLGHRGLALADPDRFALEVMSSTLSGQGGRLFLELRDKQSLCYAVSAFSVEGIDPGTFAIYMGTSPEKVDTALTGIEQLLETLAAEGITAAELDRTKRYLLGSHDIGLQRLGARASAMALNELYGLGFLSHRDYAARISAVTLEQVRTVAARLLDPQRRVLAIVGPDGTGGPPANTAPDGMPTV
jgi:zinc protease